MRLFLAFILVGACGGPSQQQLVETPAATAPWRHAEAPPASTSDEDRHHLNQQFEDMEITQQAYREAQQESQPPPTRKLYEHVATSQRSPVSHSSPAATLR